MSDISKLEIYGYLHDKIDAKQLQRFVLQNDYGTGGSKGKLLVDLQEYFNNLKDKEDKRKFLDNLNIFLLEQIKHTSNRKVITVPLHINHKSVVFNKDRLLEFMEIEEDEFSYNNLLSWDSRTESFDLFYQELEEKDSEIKLVKRAYGRKVEYEKVNSPGTEYKFEFVWFEIDTLNKCLRIIISSNLTGEVKNELRGTENELYNYFLNIARREFNITLDSTPSNHKRTLFKMYKELTAQLEKKFEDKVLPHQKKINTLVEELKKDLKIDEKDDIGLEYRIIKLFERTLVQKEFYNATALNIAAKGKVRSIIFRDRIGGSVRATAGGRKVDNVEINLEDSDVYFDTRESIHQLQEIDSINIKWNILKEVDKADLLDDRYHTVEVKYVARNNYYLTQFIRFNVSKEVYDIVLPKFEKYERKNL